MNFLFQAHSGFRYLVFLAAAAALIYLLDGTLRSRSFDRRSRILTAIFTGTLDLQVLLGVLLVVRFPFYGALAGHIVTMLLAAIVAHVVSVVNKRRPEDRRSNALALAGVAIPLGLVVVGILSIGRSVI